MKILFFHGGPGLNSNPESHLLTLPFAESGFDLVCWNEPSALRPGGAPLPGATAFERYLESAERFFLEHFAGEPIVAMAHSFGSHALCHLVAKHSEKITKAVFVSSDLATDVTDANVFRFVKKDYEEAGDPRAAELQAVISRMAPKFDANAEAGFGLVVQNPRWFDYYWLNRKRLSAFGPYLASPGFTVDVEGFFAVRHSLSPIALESSPVPALALFGEHDIVVSRDIETHELAKRFDSLRVRDIRGAAHYAHVEQTDEVLAVLRQELVDKQKEARASDAPAPSL